ncbi:MAG: hypothetical protein JWN72_1515 [Thermoleophilia bacterium]|nr:hypothetical protein [Thermoleophilia bacterium]
MTAIASPSSVAPPLPNSGSALPPTSLPSDDAPAHPTVSGGGLNSIRLTITGWMEDHLGRAGMPVAALAGAAVLGGVGMLTLGIPGAIGGGVLGAFMGASLYLSD